MTCFKGADGISISALKRSVPALQQPWALEDRASPQEALDYSMKRDAIESSRSEKADPGESSDVEVGDDGESEKSNSNRYVPRQGNEAVKAMAERYCCSESNSVALLRRWLRCKLVRTSSRTRFIAQYLLGLLRCPHPLLSDRVRSIPCRYSRTISEEPNN